MTETKAAAGEQTPIIFLDDIHVVFKTRTGSILHPNKVHAVNGLTLKLMPGETIGIVGESGCGKSTTANVMCGLQAPTSGHVYFKGVDVTKRTADQAQDHRPRYLRRSSRPCDGASTRACPFMTSSWTHERHKIRARSRSARLA